MSSSSRKQALPALHIRTNSDASTVTSQDGSLYSYGNPVTSPTSGQVKVRLIEPSSSGLIEIAANIRFKSQDESHSYEYEWPYSPRRKDSESSTSPLSPHHHHDNPNHNHNQAAKKSPTVNRLTHCGRHTDQFLFGGHSISELIRSAINRDGGRNQ